MTKVDLTREIDQWKEYARRQEAIAEEWQDYSRRQTLHIKELEAVAREAIDYAGQGADPQDPRAGA